MRHIYLLIKSNEANHRMLMQYLLSFFYEIKLLTTKKNIKNAHTAVSIITIFLYIHVSLLLCIVATLKFVITITTIAIHMPVNILINPCYIKVKIKAYINCIDT